MINNFKVLTGAFILGIGIVSNGSASLGCRDLIEPRGTSTQQLDGLDLCNAFSLFDDEPVGELSHLTAEDLKVIEKQKQTEQRQLERQMPNTGIPKDVFVLVLKLLEPSDYEKAGQVCKEFYRLTRDRSNLQAHLNSQITNISVLGVCIPLVRHLASIKFDDKKMSEFESRNLPHMKDIYRVLSFYEKVVGLKTTCPGDLVKLERDCHVAIELPDGNKYLCQAILKRALVVLTSLERIVAEDGNNPLNARLQKDIKYIKPLLTATQITASNG